MREKLATLAARPGVQNALSINQWHEDQYGDPYAKAGRVVHPAYRRADGRPPLALQKLTPRIVREAKETTVLMVAVDDGPDEIEHQPLDD